MKKYSASRKHIDVQLESFVINAKTVLVEITNLDTQYLTCVVQFFVSCKATLVKPFLQNEGLFQTIATT